MTAFKTSSRLTRTLSAAAAFLTTALVLSSVVGLGLHYEEQAAMQLAAIVPVGASVTPAV